MDRTQRTHRVGVAFGRSGEGGGAHPTDSSQSSASSVKMSLNTGRNAASISSRQCRTSVVSRTLRSRLCGGDATLPKYRATAAARLSRSSSSTPAIVRHASGSSPVELCPHSRNARSNPAFTARRAEAHLSRATALVTTAAPRVWTFATTASTSAWSSRARAAAHEVGQPCHVIVGRRTRRVALAAGGDETV